MHSRIPWQVCSREQIRPLKTRKAGDVLVMDLWAVYPVRIFNNIVDSDLYRAIIQDNAGVRAFRTHRSDLLEAFTNPSTPANLSAETAAQLSDETRKKILGLKRTKQNVSELLEEIEISLRLDIRKFFMFVENLRKENADNPLVQQLCHNLRSARGECDTVCLGTSTDQCMVF